MKMYFMLCGVCLGSSRRKDEIVACSLASNTYDTKLNFFLIPVHNRIRAWPILGDFLDTIYTPNYLNFISNFHMLVNQLNIRYWFQN